MPSPYRTISVFCLLISSNAAAVSLTSSQTDYTTTDNITTTTNNTAGSGIYSSYSGTSSSSRKIANAHVINTSGSSAYGIRTTGSYNQITNKSDARIDTSNSSGRGISVDDFSSVNNQGAINTLGSSAHGIYLDGNSSSATNSGVISIGNSNAYGINLNGDGQVVTNSGSISAGKYAIYNSGIGNVINNSGNLIGGVRIGNATLNISGGSISGVVEGSDVGNVNILGNFAQSAAFSGLDNLNISAGTFTANNAISANSIAVGGGATLKLNSDYSLSGELSGSGNLNIANGASFVANRDLSFGNILVGGVLDLSKTNNLTLAGNLVGSGSAQINLGSNQQRISGNFSLAAGDVLLIKTDTNSLGSLIISGSASIDPNSKISLTVTKQGYLKSGQRLVLLSAGAGSNLNPIRINLNGCASSCGMLRLGSEVSGNDLLLNISRPATSEIAVGKNSKKIYESLGIGANQGVGKIQEFQNYLDGKNFSDGELEQTLNQLAPQSGKARMIGSNNVVAGSLATGEIRLNQIRGGFADTPAQGSGFAQIFSPTRTLDVFNLAAQGGALKNGFWVQPFGSAATQNVTGDDVGYRAILSGVALGLDHETSLRTTTGTALSYARSETKSSDSLKKTTSNTYQINLYNSHSHKNFFIDSLGGIAFSQFASNRAIPAVGATANANYNGFSYIAKIRLGVIKKLHHGLSFIPEISASLQHNSVGGYTEKGADSLNLKVKSSNSTTLEARIGAGLSWLEKIHDSREFKKFTVALKASYGYNFINHTSNVISSFVGQNSSFNTQVNPIDPGSLRLGAEANIYHIDDITFSADYQFERRTTYQSHFAAFKVRQAF
ncbi:MAG: autotransporter domain-containing protein [Alphaproteobacteria bacterium]|nr:autotransporter domain-containing protein [Alphaproteobacteria bacterium]